MLADRVLGHTLALSLTFFSAIQGACLPLKLPQAGATSQISFLPDVSTTVASSKTSQTSLDVAKTSLTVVASPTTTTTPVRAAGRPVVVTTAQSAATATVTKAAVAKPAQKRKRSVSPLANRFTAKGRAHLSKLAEELREAGESEEFESFAQSLEIVFKAPKAQSLLKNLNFKVDTLGKTTKSMIQKLSFHRGRKGEEVTLKDVTFRSRDGETDIISDLHFGHLDREMLENVKFGLRPIQEP